MAPLPEDPLYDVLFAVDVFEHVEDYLGFIRSLHSLARWNIFHMQLDLNVLSVANPIYLNMTREQVGHLH